MLSSSEMLRRGVLFVAFALGGCQRTTNGLAEPNQPAPIVEPRQTSAEPPPDASAPLVGPVASASTPEPLALPEQCTGSSLDLDTLLRHRAEMRLVRTEDEQHRVEMGGPCALRRELAEAANSGNRALRVTVEPEERVISRGKTLKLRVRFENPTSSPLTMLIAECNPFDTKDGAPAARLFEVTAHDESGERADLVTGDFGCARDGACMSTTNAFTLAAGGVATATALFVAEQRKLVPPCSERRVRSLPAGTYRLEVRMPLVSDEPIQVETSIVVK